MCNIHPQDHTKPSGCPRGGMYIDLQVHFILTTAITYIDNQFGTIIGVLSGSKEQIKLNWNCKEFM